MPRPRSGARGQEAEGGGEGQGGRARGQEGGQAQAGQEGPQDLGAQEVLLPVDDRRLELRSPVMLDSAEVGLVECVRQCVRVHNKLLLPKLANTRRETTNVHLRRPGRGARAPRTPRRRPETRGENPHLSLLHTVCSFSLLNIYFKKTNMAAASKDMAGARRVRTRRTSPRTLPKLD